MEADTPKKPSRWTKEKLEKKAAKIGRPRKWDMEKLKTLYLAGGELQDLMKLPEFEGLSYFYLKKIATRERWSSQKSMVRTQAHALVEKSLIENIKEQTDKHYQFMLKQIDDEREQIVKRRKLTGTKDQKERLDLLESLEKIARRTLGLDEQNIADKQAASINAMISLHVSPPSKAEWDDDSIKVAGKVLDGMIEPQPNAEKQPPISEP